MPFTYFESLSFTFLMYTNYYFLQLFLSCLEGIQSENLLKDIDQHKLFSNIRDIVDANLKLWSLYLYPMVSDRPSSSFFFAPFLTFSTINTVLFNISHYEMEFMIEENGPTSWLDNKTIHDHHKQFMLSICIVPE